MKREYDFHALALRYGFNSKDMEKTTINALNNQNRKKGFAVFRK